MERDPDAPHEAAAPRAPASPRRIVALALIVLVAGALLFFAARWAAPHFTRETIASWVRAAGPWGPFVLLGLQAAQILVAPIPGVFVPVMAGILYGPVMGSLLTIGGTLLGSQTAYWIGRSAGRAVAARYIGEPALERAHKLIGGKRWLTLALVFLVPFSPADALCFVAGTIAMSWAPFTGAVFLGRVPKDVIIAAGAALGWGRLGLN